MTTQSPIPITLNLAILIDDNGQVQGLAPMQEAEGEHITIDRAAVKASTRTCVKKSEGEILTKRIKDAMEDRGMSVAEVARKLGVARPTVYEWIAHPGNCKLTTLLQFCRIVGIQQLTLYTGGTYT
ncbi:MAG: helix-turn-helix transcriptional regulator [Clostridia bacterium]|nr:helix-turn-helix transcriptional regulator [Clostridia bacterium]